jgi:hypothetical protein
MSSGLASDRFRSSSLEDKGQNRLYNVLKSGTRYLAPIPRKRHVRDPKTTPGLSR